MSANPRLTPSRRILLEAIGRRQVCRWHTMKSSWDCWSHPGGTSLKVNARVAALMRLRWIELCLGQEEHHLDTCRVWYRLTEEGQKMLHAAALESETPT